MNYIGLDYGLSKTGVATSNSIIKVATVKDTVRTEKIINYLQNIYKNEDIFVVGLPISMSGRFSKQTYETIDFCIKLKNIFNTKVLLIDERLTTQQSYSMTKNFLNAKKAKKAKDQNSALFILQRYLNSPNSAIELTVKKEYKMENIDSNSILINNLIIKNSNIYNKADVLAIDPYVFWWYYKRNKLSTTLIEDLNEEYDVIISNEDINIKHNKLIKVG
ncbi:Holliday junction resolvase RuvX [Marinitoga litoralis]|uniref:Holliday junction resolvase RuvX n=1 Tax=Marinitoga litoralis TaxID=570855 RepID=UPI00195F96E8|nr:Holliday junction resolvase RuvX [Marinitoga litoralis]MBM7560064.1 putative Holliday junction resolvase [Marinitoga litoralis]